MVPMAGVEPAQLLPLPPQDSVSTNSTTSAICGYYFGIEGLSVADFLLSSLTTGGNVSGITGISNC
jgi:hypothetical protein